MSEELIYLASPYSHAEESVREQRFRDACLCAAEMMLEGQCVFSPIAHTQPIAVIKELPGTIEFWLKQDFAILGRCTKLIVLMLDGWEQSRGIAAEIKQAQEIGLPVEYLQPAWLEGD